MGLQRKVAGMLLGGGALMIACSGFSPPASADGFLGECPTGSPTTCTLDEPEGNNPATHGTITVVRNGSVFTFTAQLSDGTSLATGPDPIQLCLVADTGQSNPYLPTDANTCAGRNGDPTKFQSFPVVFDAGSLLSTPDAPVFFALHVNIRDGGGIRTTYIVGASPVAGTASAPTTTTALAPTTTAQPTTTTAPTTTTPAPTTTTTTTPGPTTTAPATTTTTAAVTTAGTITTQASTTTTNPGTSSTTAAAPPITVGQVSGAGALSEAGALSGAGTTTVTRPATTATTAGARVLGATFTAPADTGAGTLPRTGMSPWSMLLTGTTLLCLGVILLMASSRRNARGAHR